MDLLPKLQNRLDPGYQTHYALIEIKPCQIFLGTKLLAFWMSVYFG